MVIQKNSFPSIFISNKIPHYKYLINKKIIVIYRIVTKMTTSIEKRTCQLTVSHDIP
jgi:hypothetical protein